MFNSKVFSIMKRRSEIKFSRQKCLRILLVLFFTFTECCVSIVLLLCLNQKSFHQCLLHPEQLDTFGNLQFNSLLCIQGFGFVDKRMFSPSHLIDSKARLRF
uniref:Uncharacterized protein n=1 Tax=Cacopsylla melanoneura TaxID=428564 RepID=A0A8D9F2U8_9HEMI